VTAAMATTSTASPSAGSDRLSDAQTYEITIEAAGASTVLEATDGSVSEEFTVLHNWCVTISPGREGRFSGGRRCGP
jgi:hypothetical protein